MNNGIKFSAAETGALRIGGANLAPTQNSVANPSSYWTSVESSSCGYTIYLDRPNNAPSIYVANNDNELITLTNQIANATYSTVVECLTYFNGESDKFATNKEYPGIITNGLVLNLDAGFVPSYPRSGTTWNDISGSGNNGTLINGPTFTLNGGGGIVFDGVNDYVSVPVSIGQTNQDYSITISFRTPNVFLWDMRLISALGSTSELAVGFQGINSGRILRLWLEFDWHFTNFEADTNRIYDISIVHSGLDTFLYVDGILNTTISNKTSFFTSIGIGNNFFGFGAFFNGLVYQIQIYNRALSEAEILQNYTVTKKIPTYRVRFLDIDGTILKEEFVDQGNDATAPDNPDIDPTYLVFAEWNQGFTNVDRDIEVGAMYDTIDGKTYIFVRITDTTGLQPTLDLNKTTSDTLTVDWGDSTTNTTSTNGNQTVQKTAAYAAIGDYVITLDCAGEYRNRSGVSIFDAQGYRSSVLKVYMGSTMTIQNACFRDLFSMSTISLNKSIVFDSQATVFAVDISLVHCSIPKNSTRLFTNVLQGCRGLKSVSFPPTVTTLGAGTFSGDNNLKYIDLKNITSYSNSTLRGLATSQDILIPATITNTGTNTFQDSQQITSISVAGAGLTTIDNNAFTNISSVKSLEFPDSVTSIGTSSFSGNFQILEYTFNSTTPPTLANINAFTSINEACKIYVPDASVATYKAATNWVSFADYIYPLSTRPCGLRQVNQLMKSSRSTGQYRVRFYDIDGTILKEQYVTAGADATAPGRPNYDPRYLVFAEWNQDFTNVDRDIEVGAIYDTIDGKTYIFIRLTATTGLQPTLDLNKTTSDTLTVNWGDGTTDTTTTNGDVTVQKTAAYAAIGDYVISLDCAGNYRNRNTVSIFDTQPYRNSVLKVYMGSTMTIQGTCFRDLRSMSIISLEKSINFSTTSNIFNTCRSLSHCNIPKNSTTVWTNVFQTCGSLKSISFSPTLRTLGTNAVSNCISLQYIDLKNITSFGSSTFNNTAISQDILIPTSITNTNINLFRDSYQITSISVAGAGLTTIGNDAFRNIFGVQSLEFPSSVTSIGTNSFNGNTAILEYTFNSTTPPTLANTNAFSGINAACKIYVPDASVATYKAATNWVTYANYIYPLSTKP